MNDVAVELFLLKREVNSGKCPSTSSYVDLQKVEKEKFAPYVHVADLCCPLIELHVPCSIPLTLTT